MVLFINAFYVLLLILISPWVAWRALFQRRYRKGWPEKLLGTVPVPVFHGKSVWFHAVSVGELQVIRPLVERFEVDFPELRLVISTSTDSGYELATSLYRNHTVCFAPLDFSWAIRGALDRIRPSLIILAELELWPNWVRIANSRNIPIDVINARISEKSFRGYSRIRGLIQSILANVQAIGCQTETYRNRFIELGCRPSQVTLTGNIKFDGATKDRTHPEVLQRQALLQLDKQNLVWLVGSTQSPEEQIAIDAFRTLSKSYPHFRMILVPRHAERFDEVAKLVQASGLEWARRSESQESVSNPKWQIFLADSVGELRWWWGLAQIGFVGGSFGNRGGQNMIEPCAYGVATSFGPNTRNFADVVRLLLEADAATQLAEPNELAEWVEQMIREPAKRDAMAQRAMLITAEHRGAVDRTMELLRASLLSNESQSD